MNFEVPSQARGLPRREWARAETTRVQRHAAKCAAPAETTHRRASIPPRGRGTCYEHGYEYSCALLLLVLADVGLRLALELPPG